MIRMLKILFLFIYFSCLVYIVFFARRRQGLHLMRREQLMNKTPIRNKIYEYRMIDQKNRREVTNFFTNLFGNVILFMPLPWILVGVFKIKKFWLIILTAFLLSFSIEVIQFIFKSGVADSDDILLNTFGALIGLLLMKFVINHSGYSTRKLLSR